MLFRAILSVVIATCCAFATVSVALAQNGGGEAVITVFLEPYEARLFVDGQQQPPDASGRPLKLAPGKHRLEARLPGWGSAWRDVDLKSGRDNEAVTLKLSQDGGRLRIESLLDGTQVLIDNQPVGPTPWDGYVGPGVHQIRLVAPKKDDSAMVQVIITPGEYHEVKHYRYGQISTTARFDEEDGDPPHRRGVYAILYGGLISPLVSPTGHDADSGVQGGFMGALRFGYRVYDNLGLEGMFQYSDMSVDGTLDEGLGESRYHLQSFRWGLGARLFLPARSIARFHSTLLGGVAFDLMSWSREHPGTRFQDTQGVNGYLQLDLGVELEFKNFVNDIVLQMGMESTSGLEVEDVGESAWSDRINFMIGPAITFGYGFWTGKGPGD